MHQPTIFIGHLNTRIWGISEIGRGQDRTMEPEQSEPATNAAKDSGTGTGSASAQTVFVFSPWSQGRTPRHEP